MQKIKVRFARARKAEARAKREANYSERAHGDVILLLEGIERHQDEKCHGKLFAPEMRHNLSSHLPKMMFKAKLGNSSAMFYCGACLWRDLPGIQRDTDQAWDLLSKASENGHAYASYECALLIEQTRSGLYGVSDDYLELAMEGNCVLAFQYAAEKLKRGYSLHVDYREMFLLLHYGAQLGDMVCAAQCISLMRSRPNEIQPLGTWEPASHFAATIEVRKRIFAWLLVAKHLGLNAQLGKDVVLMICGYICTR